MAARRKITKKTEEINQEEIKQEEIKPKKTNKKTETPTTKEVKKEIKEPKYKIGGIVFISKNADADLNGFKLFPQYKKCTYTVEAYDQISGVYSLRRLNLSLKVKEELIVSPEERAHDEVNRRQF